jgi:group I intron endonuclease
VEATQELWRHDKEKPAMEGNFLIYMHTSPSGKSYIGQTKNLHRRNIVHKNTDGCRLFAKAIKKYGWDNFTHTILAERLSLDEANQLEQQFIEQLRTLSPHGYNLRTGGNSPAFSEETRSKLSAALKNHPVSQETREKLSAYWKSQPIERFEKLFNAAKNKTPETLAKLSRAAKNRAPVSEATREKLSAAAKRQPPEVREKQRLSHIGLAKSPGTRAKISASAKIRWERIRNEKRAAQGSPFPHNINILQTD